MKDLNKVVEYLKNVESNARTYANNFQVAINYGLNAKIKDINDNEYIDLLGGAGTLALGHNNPIIVETLQEFLKSGQIMHGLDLSTPIKAEFTRTLFSCFPKEIQENSKIQFCGPTGSDAVDAAIKLFKNYTGRENIVAFHGGYHGVGQGTLALTGELSAKTNVFSLMPNVHFMPFPYLYSSSIEMEEGEYVNLILEYIRNALSDPNSGIKKPAAMIMEVVQGEGGCIPASPEFVRGIRKITYDLDIPLIIDEVQTGIGRTGHMFAFEESGIIPDAIVVSKAIGGGLPLSAVVYNKKYDKWLPGSHAGTFRGNQLAMATGIATINYIKDENLIQQAKEKGSYIIESIKDLKESCNIIGDVRGKGLMIGIEIKLPNEDTKKDFFCNGQERSNLTSLIKKRCFEEGIMLESGGRFNSVLRLLPPLTIEKETIDLAISKIKKVFLEVDSTISNKI